MAKFDIERTLMDSSQSVSRSKSPAGPMVTDYWTAEVWCVFWRHSVVNGQYAGMTYKETRYYLSNQLGVRGQYLHSSESVWTDADDEKYL